MQQRLNMLVRKRGGISGKIRPSTLVVVLCACLDHILSLLVCQYMLIRLPVLLFTYHHADSFNGSHQQSCEDQPVIETDAENNPLKPSILAFVLPLIHKAEDIAGSFRECLTIRVAILIDTATTANANIEEHTATTMRLLSSSAIIISVLEGTTAVCNTRLCSASSGFDLAMGWLQCLNAADLTYRQKEDAGQNNGCTSNHLMCQFRVHI